MHPFYFSCIVENAKQENAIVITINYELHESDLISIQTWNSTKSNSLRHCILLGVHHLSNFLYQVPPQKTFVSPSTP